MSTLVFLNPTFLSLLLVSVFFGGFILKLLATPIKAKKMIFPHEKQPSQPGDMRTFTAEELKLYDGENPELPIYLAIKGKSRLFTDVF
jgi:hypothetical protein